MAHRWPRCLFIWMVTLLLPSDQGSHSDWKTWKNEKAFSSQGKVRENHKKYWKIQGISDKYYFLFFREI